MSHIKVKYRIASNFVFFVTKVSVKIFLKLWHLFLINRIIRLTTGIVSSTKISCFAPKIHNLVAWRAKNHFQGSLDFLTFHFKKEEEDSYYCSSPGSCQLQSEREKIMELQKEILFSKGSSIFFVDKILDLFDSSTWSTFDLLFNIKV